MPLPNLSNLGRTGEMISDNLFGNPGRYSGKDVRKSLNQEIQQSRGARSGENIPSGYRRASINQYTPEIEEMFQQLMGHLGPDSYLNRIASGDESLFEEMEAPALRRYAELQGNLASRFSGQGIGARRSSGFQNTMNESSSQFAQDLLSRRQDLTRQALIDLQGMSRELLDRKPYENFLVKKDYPQQQQERSGDLMGGLLGGIGGAGAGYMVGGPAGAGYGGATGFYKGYTGGY